MIDEKIKAEAERRWPMPTVSESADIYTKERCQQTRFENEGEHMAFIAGANFGKEMRWVKVETELPSNDREVLLYSEKKGFQLGDYEGDGRWFSNGWIAYPTHWMPLPPEPGGE